MREWRFALLALVLVGGAAALFFTFFKRYEEEVDRGPGSDAVRNPFLAAEQLLARVDDHRVSSHGSWSRLGAPGEADVLILTDAQLVLAPSQVEMLLAWVRDGGHLIVGASVVDEDSPSLLLDRFSIRKRAVEREWNDADDAADEDEAREAGEGETSGRRDRDDRPISERLRELNEQILRATNGEREIPPEEITELTFVGESEPLRIHFSRRGVLEHPFFEGEVEGDGEEGVEDEVEEDGEERDEASAKEEEQAEGEAAEAVEAAAGPDEGGRADAAPSPDGWTASEVGIHLLQFEVGHGRLTVLSDIGIWRSDRIAKLDHAFLLRELVGEGGLVVLLFDRDVLSVYAWLKRDARAPLFALLLTLLAWLVRRGRRFGPIEPEPTPARRSLAEQLLAEGDYRWRTGRATLLLAAMRDQVVRDAQAALPGFARLSDTQRIDWLARRAGLEPEAARRALTGLPTSEPDFVELARILQRLGKAT